MPRRQSNQLIGLIAVVVVVLISAVWSIFSGSSPSTTPARPTQELAERTASTAARAPTAKAPQQSVSGLPGISVGQLPPEARTTLALIDQGGPFPYSRDGVTFQNREGLLPRQQSGYYREYTVETPGSTDRGARRIIAGRDGERFYTDDHYDSFKEIIR